MLRTLLRWCILIVTCQSTWPLAMKTQHVDFGTDNAREIMRLSKAAEMRAYMQSDSVNACDDFYKYACGNWAKNNPASREPKTGIFDVLTKAYNRKVARLMLAPKRTSESNMERKVKYFYESCLNRDDVRHNYRHKLLSVVEEFGGMPVLKGKQWQAEKFHWMDVVALILRKYGREIIIGVDIAADLTNNQVNRLYIGQLDELITSQATEYYVSLKVAMQMELHKVLGLSVELAAQTASDMVDFEQKIAAGMSDPHDGLDMADKTRLRLLEEMTDSYKPALNFTRFVGTWLGHDYRIPVYEYVEGYQKNLVKVIEETPKKVVANYILWEMLRDFRIEVGQTHEKQLTKCVDMTKKYFVKYLDNMVYCHLLQHNRGTVAKVQQVWLELKTAFEETLLSNATHWMSDPTRDKAIEKLKAMTMEINSYEQDDFNEEFGDLVISTENYFDNVINILELRGRNYQRKLDEPPKLDDGDTLSFSPAYAAEYNRIIIPVAFLQPRFLWDDVYPAALKFSTVGYIIAHELAHGFDDNIRKYDAKGNLNNWWDRNSTEAFATRKECLRQHYGEYRYGGKLLKKSNAQGENIADNVGIRIAYAAYENWLRQQQQLDVASELLQQESLPQMDYTPRQLFFIGVAQMWCTDVNRQWLNILTATDVHAPEEVRVLAMVSNFEAFAMEFKCRVGAKMHPRRKCVIY